MSAEPENLQAEWARLVIEGLIRLGAREFIVSPGSRSTPLALALLRAHEKNQRSAVEWDLGIHSVIDERSAAFFALGMARDLHVPPVLICTSGTAPAHYYPAVIEAFESRLPLIILSADRPPELQEVGAAQTIVQAELFGRFVARFTDFGPASFRPGSFEAVAHKLELAWTLSLAESRPVHLNAPFYKPLEPGPRSGELERELSGRVDALLQRTPSMRHMPRPTGGEALLATALAESDRPLFVLGILRQDEAERVAAFLKAEARARECSLSELPVWGEVASGGLPGLDVEVALRAGGASLNPDSVFQLGSRICSSRYHDWLARRRPRTVLVQSHDLLDPARSSDLNFTLSLADLRPSDVEGPRRPLPDTSRKTHLQLARAVENFLSERVFAPRRGSEELDEARALALVSRALPASTALIVGNSLPLRIANAVLPEARREGGSLTSVFVQRGVNGIDGLIAGAAGLAALPGDDPVALFLGDVSAAHDLGSLALARFAKRPLWIWVFDNEGGRIFDQLPLGRDPPAGYELWRTPPQIDFPAIAAALGLGSLSVETEAQLLGLLQAFPDSLRAKSALIRVRTRSTSGGEFLDSIRTLDANP